ncbi:hypothetical protein GW915_08410 [bacterium]|nr:hypothetical protein [bacterium]
MMKNNSMKRFFTHLPLLSSISICFYVYFPGFMTNDSYLQLGEALSHQYSSDHPAIMSALWALLLPLAPKLHPQTPLLVFHMLCLVAGLWMIFSATFPSREKLIPVCIAFFLLWPPILGLMGNIWKDVGMVSVWLLAVGLILKAQFEHKFNLLWWALIPLFYGMSVRHNAPPAMLPLLLWMCWIWSKGASKAILLKRATSLLLALFLLSALLSKALTWGSDRSFIHKYTLFDLAGISINTGKVIMPDYNQDIKLNELKEIYTPKTNEPLFGSWATKALNGPSTSEQSKETTALWLKSVLTHPLAYLKHRSQVFGATIGMTHQIQFPYHMRVSPNQIGNKSLQDFITPVRAPVTKIVKFFSQSLLFKGYLYLLLNIAVFLFFWKKRSFAFREFYLALSASSILYIATLFPMTGASDFRYNIWSLCTAVLIALHWTLSKSSPDPRIEIA